MQIVVELAGTGKDEDEEEATIASSGDIGRGDERTMNPPLSPCLLIYGLTIDGGDAHLRI